MPNVSHRIQVMSLWVSRPDGWIDGGWTDNGGKYIFMTLEQISTAHRLSNDDFLSPKLTACMHKWVREPEGESGWIWVQNGREDLDGRQLTGLACVIIPAKVNVYRFGEANAGQDPLMSRTGQWYWLIVKLSGLWLASKLSCNRVWPVDLKWNE